MTTTIEPAPASAPLSIKDYTTLPNFDVSAGIALGHALRTAAPQDYVSTQPLVARGLARLEASLASLEDAWQPVAQGASPGPAPRTADTGEDAGWAALDMRLAAWERVGERVPGLPPDVAASAARARALRQTLFPDGTRFLLLPYDREWAECERRLHLIDAQGLAPDLDALCGPQFLPVIRQAHALYGQVLGITEPLTTPVPTNLRAPLAAFREAVRYYAEKLVGTLDDEDPAAVAAVRAALRPVDELRANVTSRAGSPATSPEPDGGDNPAPPQADAASPAAGQ